MSFGEFWSWKIYLCQHRLEVQTISVDNRMLPKIFSKQIYSWCSNTMNGHKMRGWNYCLKWRLIFIQLVNFYNDAWRRDLVLFYFVRKTRRFLWWWTRKDNSFSLIYRWAINIISERSFFFCNIIRAKKSLEMMTNHTAHWLSKLICDDLWHGNKFNSYFINTKEWEKQLKNDTTDAQQSWDHILSKKKCFHHATRENRNCMKNCLNSADYRSISVT